MVSRNPELMLAFADRISYVCFVPKGFARPASRAEMLRRAALRERPEFKARLTIQDLDVLQEAVEHVEVPAEVLEGLERLTQEYEAALAKAAQAQQSYRPTKYFSNRTLVKAIKALKAAVALEASQKSRAWPLRAELRDLAALQAFLSLGGPTAEDLDVHLKSATDLRERVQLEAAQLEARLFSECLTRVLADVVGGAEREATSRELAPVVAEAADAAGALRSAKADDLARAAKGAAAAALRLSGLLRPPPRHPANAEAIRQAMALILEAFAGRLAVQDVPHAALPGYLELAGGVVKLCGGGELSTSTARLIDRAFAAAKLAFEAIGDAQQAARFDAARRTGLAQVEQAAPDLVRQLEALEQAIAELASRPEAAPESFRVAAEASRQARERCAQALLQSVQIAVRAELGSGRAELRPNEVRALSSRLAKLESVLARIDNGVVAAREVAAPRQWASSLWSAVGEPQGVGELHQRLAAALGALEMPGPLGARVLGDDLPRKAGAVCVAVEKRSRLAVPFPDSQTEAYPALQAVFPSDRVGELQGLLALRGSLGLGPSAGGPWDEALHAAGDADLARVEALVAFLDVWLGRLGAKGDESPRLGPGEASDALRRVFETKLPQVVYYERPLSRALGLLDELEANGIAGAAGLRARVQQISARATRFCEHLLESAAS